MLYGLLCLRVRIPGKSVKVYLAKDRLAAELGVSSTPRLNKKCGYADPEAHGKSHRSVLAAAAWRSPAPCPQEASDGVKRIILSCFLSGS